MIGLNQYAHRIITRFRDCGEMGSQHLVSFASQFLCVCGYKSVDAMVMAMQYNFY